LPNNEHLANVLSGFFSLPNQVRLKRGFETRCSFDNIYNWEKTVNVWESAIAEVGRPKRKWNEPRKIFTQPDFSYNGPDDSEFLKRGIKYGIQREELLGSYLANGIARDLAWGCKHPACDPLIRTDESINNSDIRPFSRNEAVEELKAIRQFSEYWENRRVESNG